MRCQNCGRQLEVKEERLCQRCRKALERKPCPACKGKGKLLGGNSKAVCPTCQGRKVKS